MALAIFSININLQAQTCDDFFAQTEEKSLVKNLAEMFLMGEDKADNYGFNAELNEQHRLLKDKYAEAKLTVLDLDKKLAVEISKIRSQFYEIIDENKILKNKYKTNFEVVKMSHFEKAKANVTLTTEWFYKDSNIVF